ncbi:hypothetical protein GQ457_06G011970 [Hibiscus cannabinus]
MTRANPRGPRFDYDPELERTQRRLQKEIRNLMNRNNGQQPADGVIAPPAPQMNQQMPARTVRDYLAEDLEGLNPAVTMPDFEAEHFELKPVMFNMLNTLGQFGGTPNENARQHVKSFLEICNSFKIHGVSNDVLKLKLFPYSLRDKAKTWKTTRQCMRHGNDTETYTAAAQCMGTAVNPSPATDTPATADGPAKADEDHNIPLPNTMENSAETSTARLKEPVEKRPPPPFPQRLKSQKQDYQFKKFLDILKQVHINLPLVEALQQMPNYAKFVKDMVTRKKRIEEFETAAATETCLALMHNKVPAKKTDPGSFTINCLIGNNYPTKALCDPGASINLMPKSVFQKLGMKEAKPTTVMLQLADHSYVQSEGKIEDILVQVDKFIFPADFLIVDCEENVDTPIILGRPFLATGRVLLDFGEEELIFRVDKPSIEQPPKLELKQLPEQLKYDYLGNNKTLHVIISSKLQTDQEERLVATLRQHKEALGWTIADIKGISPTICMHKILLDEKHKPTVDAQRRLNQAMKEVVRKEILKWLDAGIIYPISDSEWVSPVQCVPKKGGITVISNEKNELIPTRTVTGWRVCMDYRKLNKATRKDHFPLPFIDQMLDRLAGKQFYCFLDGYSGYNQIAIAPEDQSKTTFTCPYGTFAFRRMPFGLCNAPATFQRCMTAIFSDLNEDCLEIFMDDFSTFGEDFDSCLSNLEKSL